MTNEDVCTNDCTTGLTGYEKVTDKKECKCAADYAVKDGKCVKCVTALGTGGEPNTDRTAC